jgi:hypothetical protein
MDTTAKPTVSTAHRVRLAISWLLFVVFVALLSFGIVVYAQTTTHVPGLAMAVIGILGIAVLATSLRLARARAVTNRRGVYVGGYAGGYAGGSYGVAGIGNAGRVNVNQHDHWFHHHMMNEQRRRDDEYHQQQVQQK